MSAMLSSDATFSMEMFPFGHCPEGNVIMKSLVKKKQKGAILELKRRHLNDKQPICVQIAEETMKNLKAVLALNSNSAIEFMEGLLTNCVENEFFKDSQDTSDDNTNVVNAPREPIVVNQDPGEDSSPSPLHIDHCCHECGDSLDGIFCRQCTCKSCGKGAHYGYNCPPKVPIISNPEPCKDQTIDEPLQNLQSLQQQCLLGTCQRCGCNEYDGVCFYVKLGNGTQIDVSIPYSSNDSPSVANHPPQPQCRYWKIPICYDDDEDKESSIPLKDVIISGLPPCIAITPVLSTKEAVDSLIMEDEHLDTISATESDEVIKSSVEDLVQIPSESKGIPDKMCYVPLCENTTTLNALNKHSEIVVNSNDDNSSSDDDSPYGEDIDYVDASPPDVEIVSLEVVEIVDPEVERIDDDILLTIKDDTLHEKLLNVNLLIAKIDALSSLPPHSPNFSWKRLTPLIILFPNLKLFALI
ncbi:hypothetical protein Tco_1100229 [Tanacetum coccineum]